MIQIYADGNLTYDSRLEEYDLRGLQVTSGLNKGGTAEITMPPDHPAYNAYVGYRTIVKIYRDERLIFHGRALYPIDDFTNQRKVVCEGELCFLQDAIMRPYLYQASPAEIFEELIREYNRQMEPFKQFALGRVTVTDPNDYIRLESESAESMLATLNKLLDRCGGYIVFTDTKSSLRAINWLESVGEQSGQVVELGENLLDFSRTGANTDLATALLPYGAKDETTGERVTIEGITGKDYIVDEEAVAIRGTIFKTATWDDVTEPTNLLRKARAYLNEYKSFITSLELTALDLSYVDASIDSYEVGDWVRVRSKAHGVDQDFQLVDKTEDLLDPSNNTIRLGKQIRTLTSQDVAGDGQSQTALQATSSNLQKNIGQVNESLRGTTIEVTGGLGKTTQIKLTVGGETKTAELNLKTNANDLGDVANVPLTNTADLTDAYEVLLDNLTPTRFKYNGTGAYHVGFKPSEVVTARTRAGLNSNDFGGLVNLGSEYGLVYSEFIALLLYKIKKLEQRIKALES